MRPCSQRVRQLIVEELRGENPKSKAEIARLHGLHPNTVYKIARQARAAAAQPDGEGREALLRLWGRLEEGPPPEDLEEAEAFLSRHPEVVGERVAVEGKEKMTFWGARSFPEGHRVHAWGECCHRGGCREAGRFGDGGTAGLSFCELHRGEGMVERGASEWVVTRGRWVAAELRGDLERVLTVALDNKGLEVPAPLPRGGLRPHLCKLTAEHKRLFSQVLGSTRMTLEEAGLYARRLDPTFPPVSTTTLHKVAKAMGQSHRRDNHVDPKAQRGVHDMAYRLEREAFQRELCQAPHATSVLRGENLIFMDESNFHLNLDELRGSTSWHPPKGRKQVEVKKGKEAYVSLTLALGLLFAPPGGGGGGYRDAEGGNQGDALGRCAGYNAGSSDVEVESGQWGLWTLGGGEGAAERPDGSSSSPDTPRLFMFWHMMPPRRAAVGAAVYAEGDYDHLLSPEEVSYVEGEWRGKTSSPCEVKAPCRWVELRDPKYPEPGFLVDVPRASKTVARKDEVRMWVRYCCSFNCVEAVTHERETPGPPQRRTRVTWQVPRFAGVHCAELRGLEERFEGFRFGGEALGRRVGRATVIGMAGGGSFVACGDTGELELLRTLPEGDVPEVVLSVSREEVEMPAWEWYCERHLPGDWDRGATRCPRLPVCRHRGCQRKGLFGTTDGPRWCQDHKGDADVLLWHRPPAWSETVPYEVYIDEVGAAVYKGAVSRVSEFPSRMTANFGWRDQRFPGQRSEVEALCSRSDERLIEDLASCDPGFLEGLLRDVSVEAGGDDVRLAETAKGVILRHSRLGALRYRHHGYKGGPLKSITNNTAGFTEYIQRLAEVAREAHGEGVTRDARLFVDNASTHGYVQTNSGRISHMHRYAQEELELGGIFFSPARTPKHNVAEVAFAYLRNYAVRQPLPPSGSHSAVGLMGILRNGLLQITPDMVASWMMSRGYRFSAETQRLRSFPRQCRLRALYNACGEKVIGFGVEDEEGRLVGDPVVADAAGEDGGRLEEAAGGVALEMEAWRASLGSEPHRVLGEMRRHPQLGVYTASYAQFPGPEAGHDPDAVAAVLLQVLEHYGGKLEQARASPLSAQRLREIGFGGGGCSIRCMNRQGQIVAATGQPVVPRQTVARTHRFGRAGLPREHLRRLDDDGVRLRAHAAAAKKAEAALAEAFPGSLSLMASVGPPPWGGGVEGRLRRFLEASFDGLDDAEWEALLGQRGPRYRGIWRRMAGSMATAVVLAVNRGALRLEPRPCIVTEETGGVVVVVLRDWNAWAAADGGGSIVALAEVAHPRYSAVAREGESPGELLARVEAENVSGRMRIETGGRRYRHVDTPRVEKLKAIALQEWPKVAEGYSPEEWRYVVTVLLGIQTVKPKSTVTYHVEGASHLPTWIVEASFQPLLRSLAGEADEDRRRRRVEDAAADSGGAAVPTAEERLWSYFCGCIGKLPKEAQRQLLGGGGEGRRHRALVRFMLDLTFPEELIRDVQSLSSAPWVPFFAAPPPSSGRDDAFGLEEDETRRWPGYPTADPAVSMRMLLSTLRDLRWNIPPSGAAGADERRLRLLVEEMAQGAAIEDRLQGTFSYEARDSETVEDIARLFGASVSRVLGLNRGRGIGPRSKLQGGTLVELPAGGAFQSVDHRYANPRDLLYCVTTTGEGKLPKGLRRHLLFAGDEAMGPFHRDDGVDGVKDFLWSEENAIRWHRDAKRSTRRPPEQSATRSWYALAPGNGMHKLKEDAVDPPPFLETLVAKIRLGVPVSFLRRELAEAPRDVLPRKPHRAFRATAIAARIKLYNQVAGRGYDAETKRQAREKQNEWRRYGSGALKSFRQLLGGGQRMSWGELADRVRELDQSLDRYWVFVGEGGVVGIVYEDDVAPGTTEMDLVDAEVQREKERARAKEKREAKSKRG